MSRDPIQEFLASPRRDSFPPEGSPLRTISLEPLPAQPLVDILSGGKPTRKGGEKKNPDPIQAFLRGLPAVSPSSSRPLRKKSIPKNDLVGPVFHLSPPDITDGIGKDMIRKNRCDLVKYLRATGKWIFCQKHLLAYRDGYWRETDADSAIIAIKEMLMCHPTLASTLSYADYNELYRALRTEPSIQVDGILEVPDDAVNLADGIADLSGNAVTIIDHDPDFHFRYRLDITVDELENAAYGHIFEEFLAQQTCGNPNLRRLVLEMIACVLVRRQIKTAFYLVGPSGTGKTVLNRVLLELLGYDNVCTIRGINDFHDKWTVGSFEGKLLALCPDMPASPIKEYPAGILKQLVGLDPIKAEKKNKDSTTLIEKPTLLMSGNFGLRMSGSADDPAFWSRIVVIPFLNPIVAEEKDDDLYKKLLDEKAYIVHEALLAYIDLKDRNFVFTEVDVPPEYQNGGDQGLDKIVRDFVDEHLESAPGAEVSCKEIYDLFCHACPSVTSTIRSRSDGVPAQFGRALRKALRDLHPEAEDSNRIHGSFARGYRNISICEGF